MRCWALAAATWLLPASAGAVGLAPRGMRVMRLSINGYYGQGPLPAYCRAEDRLFERLRALRIPAGRLDLERLQSRERLEAALRPSEIRRIERATAAVKFAGSQLLRLGERPESAIKIGDFDGVGLKLPAKVPGLQVRGDWAQQIIRGEKPIEYRTTSSAPQPFIAIIQTFGREGLRARVIGFARLGAVSQNEDFEWEYHLTHATPVKPYVPPRRPGAVRWIADVPVRGAKSLKP